MKCFCPPKWLTFFKAVHNSQRQTILDIIRNHNQINASSIVGKVSLSQPTVSHHLKILADASVIRIRKVGKEVVYTINKEAINDCCGGFIKKFTK